MDELELQVAARLDEYIRKHPDRAEHIYRQLLIALHTRNIVTIDSIEAQALAGAQRNGDDPNQAEGDRWDQRQRMRVEQITREYVCSHFTPELVDDLVNLTLKREQIHSLEKVATLANVPFRRLVDEIQRFCALPLGETQLAPAEVVGTRVALIRHLISDQLEFIAVAKNHLTIRDFDELTRRIIGPETGMGRIGGKAGGMFLAHRILHSAEEGTQPELPVDMPESYVIRSDAVEEFLRINRLDEYQNQKYKPLEDLTRDYPLIKGVFRNSEFPVTVVRQLRDVLAKIGNDPVIVRSSSLLEDRVGTGFCGKYASFFLGNQGTQEERLRALLGAVAEVYASVLAPDPIIYRREHNLIDYVEEMAVLIQKVVGTRIGQYFLPAFAGVAFSRNEYRWSPRIKREDGMTRIVMGLGTRAVDRAGPDYPRMVALGAPTMRTESRVHEVIARSQQNIDVIDLSSNRLRSVRLADLLATGEPIPMLDKMVSIYQDDDLYPPAGSMITAEPSQLHITFDKLLRSTPFAERLRVMLQTLEHAYGRPVDVEFACDGKKFYILQCRTLSQGIDLGPVTIPENVPDTDVLFDACRYVRTGLLTGIEYIVYVDPAAYDAVPSRERRVGIARAIGRLNHKLHKRSFVLIGPGRWGSNDINLGVPVRYADINRTAMLVEVAREHGGFVPEVSFGTHFFQDLIEANIHYLPLYPDEPGNRFNDAFLGQSPNALASLLPEDAGFAKEVRVIHVPHCAAGRRLCVAMDGESDRAIAYLK